MQLIVALQQRGYSVRDLYDRVIKHYIVTYSKVGKYARCSSPRPGHDQLLWEYIFDALREMEVEWNG